MIEPGKCFCHVCGSVFEEAYYKSGSKTTGVLLKHHKTRRGEFVIEPYTPGAAPQSPDGAADPAQEKVTLAEPVGADCDGFPQRIMVKFNDEPPISLPRCCPACIKLNSKNTVLEYDYGKYPTFVIAMVGNRGAGKSTWLEAIAYHKNFSAVNSAGYLCKLDPNELDKSTGTATATLPESTGRSKLLRIKKGTKTVAMVWLLDVAGEMYENRRSPQWRLVRKREDYPGADAFIFFESAADLLGQGLDSPPQDGFDAVDVFNNCRAEGLFEKAPVAYVCTRADKLVKGEYPLKKRRDMNGDRVTSLLTAKTFDQDTSYYPQDLIPRIAQEHDSAKALDPVVLAGLSGNLRKGFLVQSCRDVKQPDGRVVNQRDECFNVMDPLLWVLNQLKIFPLTPEGSVHNS